MTDDALHLEVILHVREASIPAVELAALLGVGLRKAERLLDPLVPASVRFTERALHKLGVRPSLHQIEPVADAGASPSAATPKPREV